MSSHQKLIFRHLNSRCVLSTIFTSQRYQELIDENLLYEILALQGNLTLSSQQRKNALYILKLPPNAIYKVIYPDNFLINSFRNRNLFPAKFDEKIQQHCVSKFISHNSFSPSIKLAIKSSHPNSNV